MGALWSLIEAAIFGATAIAAVFAAVQKPHERSYVGLAIAALSFIVFTVFAAVDLILIFDTNFISVVRSINVSDQFSFWIQPTVWWLTCYLWLEMTTQNPKMHKALLAVTAVFVLYEVIFNAAAAPRPEVNNY